MFLFIFIFYFFTVDSEQLIGEWKLMEVKISNQQSILQSLDENQTQAYLKKIQSITEKSLFKFADEKKIGKTYTISIGNHIEKGAWEIDKIKNELVTASEKGVKEVFIIEKLTDTELQLLQKREKETITFIFSKK